ncbi:MAG: transporter substrate-binding domain-containing protein [bacterium]|nr:transporter substrate-binding domain-containing protein [bacterium]
MAQSTRRVIIGAFLLVILLAIILPIINQPEQTPAFPHGVIRIATDTSYPPYSQDIGGELVGIDIAIGEKLGEALGLPVQFVPTGIDALYDALKNDRVDLIISALQPEDIMKSSVRYTYAYFDDGLVMVSDAQSPINTWEQLEGDKIAYEFGSYADEITRAWSRRVRPFDKMPYELPEYALDAVRLGLAKAALVDITTLGLYLRDYPDWDVHVVYVTHKPYTIGVRMDREKTFVMTNDMLKELLDNGEIARILNEWMVYDDWD